MNRAYEGVHLYPATGTATATIDENIIPIILADADVSADAIKAFELHTNEECSVTLNGAQSVGTRIPAGATEAMLIVDRPIRRPDVSFNNTRNDGGCGITSLKLGAAVEYYIVFYY